MGTKGLIWLRILGVVGLPIVGSICFAQAQDPSTATNLTAEQSISAASSSLPETSVAAGLDALRVAAADKESNPKDAVLKKTVFGGATVALENCPYDETHARECRIHWRPMIISSSMFLTVMNVGNLYTGYWYRWETMNGKWWKRYLDSAAGWRWNVWKDDNPFMDDYIAHPMMGAITNAIWIQNDPQGMTLTQSNTRRYWRSRMRALAYSTFFSFEWKLGPIGEASIGHNGDHYFTDKGKRTNETGWVELVTTPVGGLLWTLGEDFVDRRVITHLENFSRNPFLLLSYQFLNPARATGNILRFRPPWYRDSRRVKAHSFWSDPDTEAIAAASGEETKLSPWLRYGGVHEFGAWWGLALFDGHIIAYASDVKYMPIDVRYSYLFWPHKQWALRYSPEITALALLDEPVANPTNNPQLNRKRTYGSGISPVGLQADFRPGRRVQPFLSGNGGALYFLDRVLSPEGSQFMWIIDFGGGINIFSFRKRTQALTVGYRYQHLSNADISHHNPGVEANTFYLGVSRFRSKH